MGSNSTKYKIEPKIWQKGYDHEFKTQVLERTRAITVYEKNEKLSLGKADLKKTAEKFNNEFNLIDKGWGYIDATRNNYSNKDECCFIDSNYFTENNIIFTCDPLLKNFNTKSYCDDVIHNICNEQLLNNTNNYKNCPIWIKSVVANNKKNLSQLISTLSNELYADHIYTQTLINSLREFSTVENNFDFIADKIINSYSEELKKTKYKCAFSPENIILTEQEQRLNKECWYKECVFSQEYLLLSENIKKRKECVLTICDINIKNLNISNNDIKIICQNKFNKNRIDLTQAAFFQDQITPFFIPTYINTVVPIFFLLFLILK